MSVEAKRKIGTKRNDIVTTIIIQKKKKVRNTTKPCVAQRLSLSTAFLSRLFN